jgi:hypothetical protein
MNHMSQLIAEIDFDNAADEIVANAWSRSPLARVTDSELVNAAAAVIATPKATQHSSFILHAPLELAARALLLPYVGQNARDDARRQIASFARRYLNLGDALEIGAQVFENAGMAAAAVKEAIAIRNVNAAYQAMRFLETRIDAEVLMRELGESTVSSLAAAAHAPILLNQLPRLSAVVENPLILLRAPIRFLAQRSDLRIRWIDRLTTTQSKVRGNASLRALEHALREPPRSQAISTSIAPMVEAIDVDPAFDNSRHAIVSASRTVSHREAKRCLFRVAAHSMLQDDPNEAPYGWTHCLTIPQGILGCSPFVRDAQRAFACAATHTLAMRAKHGVIAIDLAWSPPTTHRAVDEVTRSSPIDAAAIAFHQATRDISKLKKRLADYAATHHDAHLVKYTLACFDAADEFPQDVQLFLASAAYLQAWWRTRGESRP